MKSRELLSRILFLCLISLIPGIALGQTPTSYFADDFENGLGNWTISGQDWGLTTSSYHSAGNAVTDSPAGNYPNNANSMITLTQAVDLSTATAPVLSFWHKLSVDNSSDKAIVEISDDGGYTWFSLVEYTYSKANWSNVQLDLTLYKSVPLKIRFRLTSNSSNVYDGWTIDDVQIREKDTATLPFPFSDNFENGLGNWIVSGQDWDLITSSYHSAVHCVTDSPTGNYDNYANAVLKLAKSVDLSGTTFPMLTFWHWYNSGYSHKLKVEISKNGGIDWSTIAEYSGPLYSSAWIPVEFDLTTYKSTVFQLRFRLTSDGTTPYNGWYIDDVALKEWDTPPFAPTGVTAGPGSGKMTIQWDGMVTATSYDIYWSTSSGFTRSTGTKIANVTSPYVHTGLTNDTTYYYMITAVNGLGESANSVKVSATPRSTYIPPPAPSTITPASGDGKVTLSWTSVSGASSYNLYWSTSPGVTKTTGTKIANVRSPYMHTGLTNFTAYYYILTSVNSYGDSEASVVVSSTPEGPPSSPPEVTADGGIGRTTISWNSVNGADYYNIYYGTAPGVTPANGTRIFHVTSPYTHKGLDNLTYYYVVTAVNDLYGESVISGEASALSQGPPFAPSQVRATDKGNGQITITWDNIVNAASYNLYWSQNPGVTSAAGTKISVTTDSYTHTGLTNLTRYYYVVTAVNAYGESAPSPEASETPTSTDTMIKYGQVVAGSIGTIGQTHSYKFYASSGDVILVSMSTVSNGFASYEPDAHVRVFAPDGSNVCEGYKELGPSDPAAHAEIICSLPASGGYTVIAGDYGGNSTGSYSLYVQRLNNPGNAAAIAFGQTLSGTIPSMADMGAYSFFASAGDKVIVSMSTVSNGFASYEPDAHVRVFAPDGSEVCEGYKELGPSDPAAHAEIICSLPASGAYTVIAGDYGGVSTGSYSLYVQRLNNPGNATAIAFGQTLSGTIPSMANMGAYSFFASADDKVIVSMSTVSNGFASYEPDAHVRVFAPDGSKVCEGYKELGPSDPAAHAEIICSLPASGGYTVIAGDYGGNSTGKYSVSLSCILGFCGGMTTYDIVATAGVNGTIVPSGMVTLNVGNSQTFTILANANCHIADVLVDGKSVGPLESYTFSNLSANHSIQASFGGTKQLAEVVVNGSQPQMTVGGAPQTLTATARYSDRSTEAIAQPDWTSLDQAVATVTAGGGVTAIAAGSTSITASYGGRAGKFDITVGAAQAKQHQGNLILVAGGGVARDNTLKESTEYLADLVYARFRSRMFSDDDIYFFSPKSWHDLDGDGFRDNIVDDDYPTVAKFSQAITSWAAGQNSDGPLYIYLIDHGGVGQFVLFPGQILTAGQLKSDLDAFQNATGRQVVVVIEACKSGTFTDTLTINPATQQRIGNRIVVTSTGELNSYQDRTGRISFTQFFVDRLFTGDSVNQSYLKARQILINRGIPYSLMQPQLIEESTHPSMGNHVGGAFVIASIFPEFSERSPDMLIDALTSHLFYATLSSLEGIESVWAVVTPPDYAPPPTSADFTAPQVNLPLFSLADPDGNGKYEGAYNQFTRNGDYMITFYARNRSGHLTASAATRVAVQGALEMGDLNGDHVVNLADAVIALQIMAGNAPAGSANMAPADVNGDGKIGPAEAVYILQKAAELR